MRIANVGARATNKAMGKAITTASGGGRGIVTSGVKVHKGSSAGLRNEKKVPITMNGTGYLNPNNYKARYNKKSLSIPGVAIPRDSFAPISYTTDLRTYKSQIGSTKIFRERY